MRLTVKIEPRGTISSEEAFTQALPKSSGVWRASALA